MKTLGKISKELARGKFNKTQIGTQASPSLRVCVLTSSYEGTVSPTEAYDNYLCTPAHWVSSPKFDFTNISIEKANSYSRIRELVHNGHFDVFYNLCDGAKDEKRAGVDVIHALETMNAAFTGADSRSFEPNKVDMKVLVANAKVRTPNFVLLDSDAQLAKKCRHLRFPVIVKHMSGYASVGITKDSKCDTLPQLQVQARKAIAEFNHALVEEFIRGREGTVLVCADKASLFGIRVFRPLMLSFLESPDAFAHFENKWTSDWATQLTPFLSELDPSYGKVIEMARNAFKHIMNGVGYGRCDFRIDATGEVYFLEINPNCGMLYDPQLSSGGDYADVMVKNDKEWDHSSFIKNAIQLALEQQRARTPWFHISHDAKGKFSTRATRDVPKGTALFGDVSVPVPVVAKSLFKVGEDDPEVGCVVCRGDGRTEVVAVRHSCEANMYFMHGRTLTFESKRAINKGEELTVDYGTLRDECMPTFSCHCGTASCRSVIITGVAKPRADEHRRQRKLIKRLAAQKAAALIHPSTAFTKVVESSQKPLVAVTKPTTFDAPHKEVPAMLSQPAVPEEQQPVVGVSPVDFKKEIAHPNKSQRLRMHHQQ